MRAMIMAAGLLCAVSVTAAQTVSSTAHGDPTGGDEISEECKRHPFTIYELDEFDGTEIAILARGKRKGLGFAAVRALVLASGRVPGVWRGEARSIYLALSGDGSAMVVMLTPRWKHLSPDAPLRVRSGGEVYEYPAFPADAARAVLRRVDMESNLLEWQAYAADSEALLALAADRKSLFRVQKKDSWIDVQALRSHHVRMAEWIGACIVEQPAGRHAEQEGER